MSKITFFSQRDSKLDAPKLFSHSVSSRKYIIQVRSSVIKTLVVLCFGYSPNCCMNLSGLHCATVEVVGVVLRALRVLYPALGDSIRRREIRCSSMGLPFALTARSFSLLVIHDRHQKHTTKTGKGREYRSRSLHARD